MAVDVSIMPATEADARELAPNLRAEDAQEVIAAAGDLPGSVLVDAVRSSAECHTVRFNGEIACMWGVVDRSDLSEVATKAGSVWLLSSGLVERYAKTFWRLCLDLLPDLLERWDVLFNFIDARHEKALRWARRLGFRVFDPEPYGHVGLPFHAFFVTKGGACAIQP